jgi:U3 small nucleolar RNA-associated protein 3
MPEFAGLEARNQNEDDDMVSAELRKRELKKLAKRELLLERAKAYIPPVAEETVDRRSAGYQIMKNKGLTRKRKKEVRNSRVKYRNKFEKALIRRKGQVQDTIREGASNGIDYAGEESGIRTHLKKSTRLS